MLFLDGRASEILETCFTVHDRRQLVFRPSSRSEVNGTIHPMPTGAQAHRLRLDRSFKRLELEPAVRAFLHLYETSSDDVALSLPKDKAYRRMVTGNNESDPIYAPDDNFRFRVLMDIVDSPKPVIVVVMPPAEAAAPANFPPLGFYSIASGTRVFDGQVLPEPVAMQQMGAFGYGGITTFSRPDVLAFWRAQVAGGRNLNLEDFEQARDDEFAVVILYIFDFHLNPRRRFFGDTGQEGELGDYYSLFHELGHAHLFLQGQQYGHEHKIYSTPRVRVPFSQITFSSCSYWSTAFLFLFNIYGTSGTASTRTRSPTLFVSEYLLERAIADLARLADPSSSAAEWSRLAAAANWYECLSRSYAILRCIPVGSGEAGGRLLGFLAGAWDRYWSDVLASRLRSLVGRLPRFVDLMCAKAVRSPALFRRLPEYSDSFYRFGVVTPFTPDELAADITTFQAGGQPAMLVGDAISGSVFYRDSRYAVFQASTGNNTMGGSQAWISHPELTVAPPHAVIRPLPHEDIRLFDDPSRELEKYVRRYGPPDCGARFR